MVKSPVLSLDCEGALNFCPRKILSERSIGLIITCHNNFNTYLQTLVNLLQNLQLTLSLDLDFPIFLVTTNQENAYESKT